MEMSFEKRVFMALAVCAGIWILFTLVNPPEPPPEEGTEEAVAAEQEGKQSETKDGKSDESKAEDTDAKEDSKEDDPPAAPTPKSDIETEQHSLANDTVEYTVTNRAPGRGGILEGIHLLSDQFADHETEKNAFDLAGAPTLEVSFADAQSEFVISGGTPYTVREVGDKSITLAHVDEAVEVTQTFEVLEGYEALLTVKVRNLTDKEQQHRMHVATRVGLGGEQSRYNIKRGLCRTAEDFEYEDQSDVEDGPITYKNGIQWSGADNKYFGTLVVPTEPFADCVIQASEDGRFLVASMGSPTSTVAPDGTREYTFGLFIGAKELEALQAFSAVQSTGGELHLEEAVDWGILGGLSEALGRMLLSMMRFFYGWVGMWGWAIVLLTVVVKLVTLPLTLKQMASMKAMKRIQPEMAKIKEKYADDKVKQGQEMQALFGRAGVNPLAGCLPLIVQMPIWFALYSMLGRRGRAGARAVFVAAGPDAAGPVLRASARAGRDDDRPKPADASGRHGRGPGKADALGHAGRFHRLHVVFAIRPGGLYLRQHLPLGRPDRDPSRHEER